MRVPPSSTNAYPSLNPNLNTSPNPDADPNSGQALALPSTLGRTTIAPLCTSPPVRWRPAISHAHTPEHALTRARPPRHRTGRPPPGSYLLIGATSRLATIRRTPRCCEPLSTALPGYSCCCSRPVRAPPAGMSTGSLPWTARERGSTRTYSAYVGKKAGMAGQLVYTCQSAGVGRGLPRLEAALSLIWRWRGVREGDSVEVGRRLFPTQVLDLLTEHAHSLVGAPQVACPCPPFEVCRCAPLPGVAASGAPPIQID